MYSPKIKHVAQMTLLQNSINTYDIKLVWTSFPSVITSLNTPNYLHIDNLLKYPSLQYLNLPR